MNKRGELSQAAAAARRTAILDLVDLGFTTSAALQSRTRWNERTVLRYLGLLANAELVERTPELILRDGGGWWRNRYTLTDAGRRAIAAG